MTRRYIRPIPILVANQEITEEKTPKYENYQEYLLSPRWFELREQAVRRDGIRCRLCNSSKMLEVHHRKYPKVWGEETVEDLTTLCGICHSSIYNGFVIPKVQKIKFKKINKHKKRNPGSLNSLAQRLLLQKGYVFTEKARDLKATARAICRFKNDPIPEGGYAGGKALSIKIISEFVGYK